MHYLVFPFLQFRSFRTFPYQFFSLAYLFSRRPHFLTMRHIQKPLPFETICQITDKRTENEGVFPVFQYWHTICGFFYKNNKY